MTKNDIFGNPVILPGNITFVDKNGKESPLYDLEDQKPLPVIIDSDNSGSEDVDVSSEWGDNDGILLDLLGRPESGNYQTTVNWTLKDTL